MDISQYEKPQLRSLALVPAAILLVLCLCTSATSQIVGGLTVGALLDRFTSQVKEIEDKAIAGGMVLEIGAGGEVSLAIQQAKAAYSNSLDKTFAKLDAQDQVIFNSLNSLVDKFAQVNRSNLSDLLDEARGIIHDLPLSKHFPQVYRFTPGSVVGTNDIAAQPILLELTGDFVDLAEPGYTPTLKIFGRTFNASAKSSGIVLFKLPGNIFHTTDKQVKVDFATIDIPYTNDSIFRKEAHTEFIIPISTLPKKLGNLTITITTPVAGTISHEIVSPHEFIQDSSNDDIKDGGEHADLAIHRWAATSGWRIIPASVHYRMNWHQGTEGVEKDWWFGRNLSTLQEAVLTFSTEHHRIGTSGKIHFNIIFTEEKDVLKNDVHIISIDTDWKTSRVIELPAGATWKAKFTRYDGDVREFSGPFNNNLIKVTQSGSLINFECIH